MGIRYLCLSLGRRMYIALSYRFVCDSAGHSIPYNSYFQHIRIKGRGHGGGPCSINQILDTLLKYGGHLY